MDCELPFWGLKKRLGLEGESLLRTCSAKPSNSWRKHSSSVERDFQPAVFVQIHVNGPQNEGCGFSDKRLRETRRGSLLEGEIEIHDLSLTVAG